MKFNINDKVRIKVTGETGTVLQTSDTNDTTVYIIEHNGKEYICMEDFLEPIETVSEINVRGVIEPQAQPNTAFIEPQTADKNASIKRKVSTEEFYEQWKVDINRTNLRELPEELKDLYNAADLVITDILKAELQIICGR